jgi:hypothetical protein
MRILRALMLVIALMTGLLAGVTQPVQASSNTTEFWEPKPVVQADSTVTACATSTDGQVSALCGVDPCMAKLLKVVPIGCLDFNRPEWKHARKQLGANPYSYPALKKRFGTRKVDKRVAKMTQKVIVLTTHDPNAGLTPRPTLVKKVPYPSYKAKSRTNPKLRKIKYVVYEIAGETKGPIVQENTWKYGITRQIPWQARPKSQLAACMKYWEAKYPGVYYRCPYRLVYTTYGWYNARVLESNLTLLYALNHNGHCPPGMPKCV